MAVESVMSPIGLWPAVLKQAVCILAFFHLCILEPEVTICGQQGGAGEEDAAKPAKQVYRLCFEGMQRQDEQRHNATLCLSLYLISVLLLSWELVKFAEA